jgi:hypothetical protein
MYTQKMPEDIATEIRLITPDEARSILNLTPELRKVSSRTVEAYSRDMAAGLWKLNGEPIVLSASEEVLNGVIRLSACVKANCSFPTLVVRGIDVSAAKSSDALRRRTVADVLTIRKEKDGRALAAALAHICRLAVSAGGASPASISSQHLLKILELNPDIRLSLRLTRDVHPLIPHGLATALHYIFSTLDSKLADEFFQDLVEQDGTKGKVTTQLKRQLEESVRARGARNIRMISALVIKSWEAGRKSISLLSLRYAPDERFPQISGFNASALLDDAVSIQNDQTSSVVPSDIDFSGLKSELLIVTPEMAKEFLSRNTGNRGIATAVVDRYARDIAASKWDLNGQTIKFAKSGRLLDGQHRCAAAIQANCRFMAIIVSGLDDDVFGTFDLGARRAIGDLLDRRGEQNTSTLGSVLRQAWLIEKGMLQHRAVAPTVAELFDFLEDNPEIRDSVRCAHKIREVVAPSLVCALHYFFSRVNKPKANDFIDRLGDGIDLSKDNPVWHLRDKFIKDKNTRKRSMSDAERAALIIKAWNAFLPGTTIKQLKWQDSGPKKEEFPSILGRVAQAKEVAA